MVVMLFLLPSCQKDKNEFSQVNVPRAQQPQLRADSVTTLISDSGVTRFRISTPLWLVFDKAKEPYWSFPKGIKFEKFNEKYIVDARMHADKATYFSDKSLWEFDGHVSVRNLQKETFNTEQLFWDNEGQRFYSDKAIKIKQKDKIIKGVGFESNATLTQYTIRKPTGIIPVDEKQ